MHAAIGLGRQVVVVTLALVLGVGCGRWQPAKSYDVAAPSEPQQSYAAVLEVGAADRYKVISKDEGRRVRFQSHINDGSYIDVEVSSGKVRLAAAGKLVRGDKVHKGLAREVSELEGKLEKRLKRGASVTAAVAPMSPAPAESAAPSASAEPASPSGVPLAWTEPAYDPSVWGNGNFTCLPVRVPVERQATLSLQLSSGEKADLQLSLAYAPELCRSPAQCKVPGGCPALGIGDAGRVSRIASRLNQGEIRPQAVLYDGARAVVTIDLTKHGTIAQALTELKR